jgi:hypothetical protein
VPSVVDTRRRELHSTGSKVCVALHQTDRHRLPRPKRGPDDPVQPLIPLSHITDIAGEARHQSSSCIIPSTAREHLSAQPRIIPQPQNTNDHAFLPFRSNRPFEAQEKTYSNTGSPPRGYQQNAPK